MLSLTILSILTISSNASIHPSTIQLKGFRKIQQGFTQNELQKLEHIVRQEENLQKLSLMLHHFRGGAEFPSGNNTLKDDQDDSTSNLWGSISGAFQINIDAKDELLTEVIDDLGSDDDESQNDVIDEEESSLSSDEDEPMEEEEITMTNELSDETEEDSDIYINEDEDTTEEEENLNEEQSEEETMNDVNLTVEVVNEDQDVDAFDEEDEYDIEEVEDNIEVANTSDSENEYSDKEKDSLDKTLKDNDQIEDVEIMDEAEEYIPTDTEPDEENGHVSVFEDVGSTSSDSEVLPTDTAYQIPTESLEEIVKKEWDMIPETEVEDEGKENEIRKGSKRQNQNNAKKKSRKKKEQRHEREQKDSQIKSSDEKKEKKASQPIISEIRNEESTKQKMKEPSQVMKEAIMKSKSSQNTQQRSQESPFISSGLWETIDKYSSFGLSLTHEELRLSRRLRTLRKTAAYYTGLHGFISGKGKSEVGKTITSSEGQDLNDKEVSDIRKRIAAIEAARRRIASVTASTSASKPNVKLSDIPRWRRPFARRARRLAQTGTEADKVDIINTGAEADKVDVINPTPRDFTSIEEEQSFFSEIPDPSLPPMKPIISEVDKEKVKEIDRLIQEGQRRILELQIQKDELQKSPNPLYNYTAPIEDSESSDDEDYGDGGDKAFTGSRVFNFPSEKLVSEYIEELFSMRRLQKMNHTELWKRKVSFSDEEDEIGDDLLTPSGDARKLYENKDRRNGNTRRNGNGTGGGSWLLRQSLGTGSKLGEKIGEAIETAAYRGVCSAVMSVLARSIAALHGVNVMKHSDIRLFVESATDLPPVSKVMFEGDDYAKEAIGKAIRKGSKKKRKRKRAYQYGSNSGDDSFVQRDAVVETLISHCQISAPLLKLFPQAWQRALLGNIITLIAAVVSDFAEGVQFQILGHQLSFSFKPITEADMIQHIGVGGFRFNHRRAKPEEFEAAVRATADDISQGLGFLDRWHQRALGGDLLRAQIGNLIARVVLTLVDEVLHSARMDLWSSQVGGPRVVAGLEYRSDNTDDIIDNQ